MAVVTYLIRVLPLVLIRKKITNTTIRSFLYYMPYVTLSVMTFPAILDATGSTIAGAGALVVCVVLALKKARLFVVSISACIVVFLLNLIPALP
jgi:branched-subunit amino acid transport protein